MPHIRTVLIVVGVVALLQLVGVDVVGMATDAVSDWVARQVGDSLVPW